jgi:class 3 adenylate cyclase
VLPETQYARVDGLHIAFQVVGDGPVDLVLVDQWVGHMEAQWDVPPMAELRRRLASFSRLILFDKRGVGMSDPVPLASLPSIETWMDDLRAVMDAASSGEAVLIATMAGTMLGVVFAASHPDRVRALIVVDGFARMPASDDYPAGQPLEEADRRIDQIESSWGRGFMLDLFAPSMRAVPGVRDAWGRYERMAGSPGVAQAMIRNIYRLDVRDVLPLIRVPTLIIQRPEARGLNPGHGRYLAARIPGARHVELPGSDNLIWAGDQEAVVAEIEEFVTGARKAKPTDRRLATVLFTDIVDSTRRAASIGDSAWRTLLGRHDAVARTAIERSGGQLIKSTGDGVLATFDRPSRALETAIAIRRGVEALGLRVRAGLHTGEIELAAGDVAGLAVHIASRVASLAGPSDIFLTSTVRDLVLGSDVELVERGSRVLKGVPGRWRIFALAGEGGHE